MAIQISVKHIQVSNTKDSHLLTNQIADMFVDYYGVKPESTEEKLRICCNSLFKFSISEFLFLPKDRELL